MSDSQNVLAPAACNSAQETLVAIHRGFLWPATLPIREM